MNTEEFVQPATTHYSQPLQNLINRFQSQISNLEHEFQQSKLVWKNALATERGELLALLKEKEALWTQQETNWKNEKVIYEKTIQQLDLSYQKQLEDVQKNALEALNRLESAWQAEKLRWFSSATSTVRPLDTTVPAQQLQTTSINNQPTQVAQTIQQPIFSESIPTASSPNVNQTIHILNEQVQLLKHLLQNMRQPS